MTHSVTCADCGAPMVLRPSKYGQFYGCSTFPACRGTHGAHPDGRPLGKPATLETKRARMEAHQQFDKLWQDPSVPLGVVKFRRTRAYAWLAAQLKLTADECHIGQFDKAMCERVIALCTPATLDDVRQWYAAEVKKGAKP